MPDIEYISTMTDNQTKIEGMMYIKAKIDNKQVQYKFYLVPNVQPEFILGLDFLGKNNVNLQFGHAGSSISSQPNKKSGVQENVTVPPKSQVAFIARIRGAPLPSAVTGITSESPHLMSMGLLPSKALVTNQFGDIQYMCENVTDKPIVIQKGSNIGKFTCISEKHQMYEVNTEDYDSPSDHSVCYKCEHGLESVNEVGKSMYGNSAGSQHGYTCTQIGEMCVICSHSVSECTFQGGNESVIRDGDVSSQYTDKHADTHVAFMLCNTCAGL